MKLLHARLSLHVASGVAASRVDNHASHNFLFGDARRPIHLL